MQSLIISTNYCKVIATNTLEIDVPNEFNKQVKFIEDILKLYIPSHKHDHIKLLLTDEQLEFKYNPTNDKNYSTIKYNGDTYLGAILSQVSSDSKKIFDYHDLIIKGQSDKAILLNEERSGNLAKMYKILTNLQDDEITIRLDNEEVTLPKLPKIKPEKPEPVELSYSNCSINRPELIGFPEADFVTSSTDNKKLTIRLNMTVELKNKMLKFVMNDELVDITCYSEPAIKGVTKRSGELISISKAIGLNENLVFNLGG